MDRSRDQVLAQPGELNFVVWSGAGGAWLLTPQWALNIAIRFVHISNGEHVHRMPALTSTSHLPGFPIPSFNHVFGPCKACLDPVS